MGENKWNALSENLAKKGGGFTDIAQEDTNALKKLYQNA